MEAPVGADDASGGWAAVTRQVGERAARFLYEHLQRRHVPERDLGFGADVDGSFGDQAMRPEVAECAVAPDGLGQFEKAFQTADLGPPSWEE